MSLVSDMGFEVPCACGRRVAVTSGDAGSSVGCACGREVAVPTLTELRRSAPPPPYVPPKWECPRCNSTAVVRLPPSSITPHPGYKCHDCGLKLRARGMAVIYGAVLVLAAVVFAVFATAGRGGTWKVLGTAALCSVYSAVQLFRPTPRPHAGSPTPDDGRLE